MHSKALAPTHNIKPTNKHRFMLIWFIYYVIILIIYASILTKPTSRSPVATTISCCSLSPCCSPPSPPPSASCTPIDSPPTHPHLLPSPAYDLPHTQLYFPSVFPTLSTHTRAEAFYAPISTHQKEGKFLSPGQPKLCFHPQLPLSSSLKQH